MMIDKTDKALLSLLQSNSRASNAFLARELNLSRTTVVSRIERLEKRGVIIGYTVKLDTDFEKSQIHAHVMISSDPKQNFNIVSSLKKIPDVRALHAVNGVYEMLALVSSDSTQYLDEVLDQIGAIEGIQKTTSSIVLSTKFSR